MSSKNVFALGFHADYRCRHSGACCTADWDVPVELPVYRSLSDALVGGRLQVASAAGATYPFIVEPDLPDGRGGDPRSRSTAGTACSTSARRSGASCTATSASRICRPRAGTFPRVSVQDRRGTFVSLSHFCPTAASMLFRRCAGGDRRRAAGVSGHRLRRPHRHRRRPAAAAASASADGPRRVLGVGAPHGRPLRGRASSGPSRCWRR